jgi:hypothetical protein
MIASLRKAGIGHISKTTARLLLDAIEALTGYKLLSNFGRYKCQNADPEKSLSKQKDIE